MNIKPKPKYKQQSNLYYTACLCRVLLIIYYS